MSASCKCFLILCMLVFHIGCSHGIPGSGVSQTETRAVGEFHSVAHDGVGEVSITIGEPQNVSITFDDNLLELVETSVVDGELHIKTLADYRSDLGMKVAITVPAIDGLKVTGVGSLKAGGIDSENLTVKISGVGGVNVSGKVKNLDVVVSGVGSADLGELQAESAKVKVSGVGSATVYASQSIDANTSGIGGIRVLGKPQDKNTTQSGIGKITIEE